MQVDDENVRERTRRRKRGCQFSRRKRERPRESDSERGWFVREGQRDVVKREGWDERVSREEKWGEGNTVT